MTKTSTLLLSLILLSSAVGCQKTTDLGKMQEETIGSVKLYMGELDILARRQAELVAKKAQQGAPENKAADERLHGAKSELDVLQRLAGSAPTLVTTAAKSGNADELVKVSDETIEHLERGLAVVREDLDAYDLYLASVDMTPAKAPKAPPAPPAPPTDPNTPVANDGAGSAAVPPPAGGANIPCTAEIALQCPTGQIDACLKQPHSSTTHRCVPAT